MDSAGGAGDWNNYLFPRFRRGAAPSMLKLGKNIREGNPLAKKPPTLTVIDSASKPNPLAPPASLGEAGVALWRSVIRDYIIDDAGGHEMLRRICEAADNLAAYDEEIGRDGVTIKVRGSVREHPLLKHRQAAQSFVVRSLHRLNLDVIPARTGEFGRPSGGGDYHGEKR
jgi:hypothetical protein